MKALRNAALANIPGAHRIIQNAVEHAKKINELRALRPDILDHPEFKEYNINFLIRLAQEGARIPWE